MRLTLHMDENERGGDLGPRGQGVEGAREGAPAGVVPLGVISSAPSAAGLRPSAASAPRNRFLLNIRVRPCAKPAPALVGADGAAGTSGHPASSTT